MEQQSLKVSAFLRASCDSRPGRGMAENARALLHAHYATQESQLGSKAMPFVPSAIPSALGYDKAALDRAVRQNSPEVTTLQHMVSEKACKVGQFHGG